MKLFLAFVFAALLIAPAVHAQTIDPQAAILKAQIEGFIDAQKVSAQKNGCKLVANGAVTVEKANGYYAFTLPHMTFTDAKGVRSEIGMVAINATPDGTDNWKVSLAIPTPINSFTSAGKSAARTDIGSQAISGVWNVKLGHFTQLNGNIGSMRVSDLIENKSMTIGSITLSSQLSERESALWSGKALANFNDISFTDARTAFTANLSKIKMESNVSSTASSVALTKDQIKSRPQNGQPDGYQILASLIGAPEQALATVTGLDSVNTQLQKAMLTAKPNQRQLYLTSILAVSAVSGIGRPVPNDTSSKTYDVVFGPAESITINGTDFGSLLMNK